jgi:hypothetical protein
MRKQGMKEEQICRAFECNPKTIKPGDTPSTCGLKKCYDEMFDKKYDEDKRSEDKSESHGIKGANL